MRKVIILLLVIGVIGALYLATRDEQVEIKVPSTTDSSTRPDPSNATFEFEDGFVTLFGGSGTRSIAPDSGIKEEITLTDMMAYGDLNSDKRNDAAVLIVRTGGGSGVFVYVAGFVSGLVNYKGTNALFVGDRVSPKSVSIANGVVTVTYLDRRADEPFAAEPTLEVSKQYSYSSGKLVER